MEIEDKKGLISFGEVNKKWLLFLVFIIIAIFQEINELVKKKNNSELNNFYFQLFVNFLSFFLNGIIIAIYLIIYKIYGKKSYLFSEEIIANIEKKEEGNYLTEKQKMENSKNQEKLSQISRSVKWLFISSLVYVISHILYSYMKTTKSYINRRTSLITFPYLIRIITTIILSNIFIKYIKIYKHHYVSIIAIIILILIINIVGLILNDNQNISGFLKVAFVNFCISFNYVFGGVFLNKSKGNVLLLSFSTSIFLFISIILIHIINLIIQDCSFGNSNDVNDPNIFCNNNEFKKFYDDFDKFKNLNTYIYLFLTFFRQIINWYIIYIFSPNHYAAISSIEVFFITLITLKEAFNGLIIYLFASLLIVFFLMVYNEMIILNFCGLEKNTKVEIYKRAEKENSNLILNDREEEEGKNQKVEIGNYQVDMEG